MSARERVRERERTKRRDWLTFWPPRCRHVSITHIRQSSLPNQLARVLQEGAKVPVGLLVFVEASKLVARMLAAHIRPAAQPRKHLRIGASQRPEGIQIGGDEWAHNQALGTHVRALMDGRKGPGGDEGTEAEPGRHSTLFKVLQAHLDLERGQSVLEVGHAVHLGGLLGRCCARFDPKRDDNGCV